MDIDTALVLFGIACLMIFIQGACDSHDAERAARHNAWLAWQAMHPELFTPGSKGDRINRELHSKKSAATTGARDKPPQPLAGLMDSSVSIELKNP